MEEIVYGVLEESPVGRVFVALSEAGVVALDFGVTEGEFVSSLQRAKGPQPVRDQARAAPALRQIREYFDAGREAFDLPLDLDGLTAFQRLVLEAAAQVKRGEIVTYGDIARRIGRPRAARAVGQALARNPLPILLPCHRVAASDGSLTGFGAGEGIKSKAQLLRLEGALLE